MTVSSPPTPPVTLRALTDGDQALLTAWREGPAEAHSDQGDLARAPLVIMHRCTLTARSDGGCLSS